MQTLNRRAIFRQGLSNLFTPYYDSLCNLLGPEWQPYSGYRSFSEQDTLYAKGGALTKAKGGESAHNYGCASDWIIWDSRGNPIWIDKHDRKWDEYTTAIWKCGLRAGADFGDVDHSELHISCSWKEILAVYNKLGIGEAMKKVDASIVR